MGFVILIAQYQQMVMPCPVANFALGASRCDTETLYAEFHLERTLDHATVFYPDEENPGIQWRLVSYRHCRDKQHY